MKSLIVIALLVFSTMCISATENTKLTNEGPAPEIQGIHAWINSGPLNTSSLRGKVILVDFWTYSCVNCIRTLPYLEQWYSKYSDKGLIVIGVHTPEFDFEKNDDNVRAAVQRLGVKYPVAMDNDYATWKAFGNSYWPRKYIISQNGSIVYDHIGEGGYAETEAVIQQLLGIKTDIVNMTEKQRDVGSPEIYFGYKFARQPLGNAEGFVPDTVVNYAIVNITQPNTVYLREQWKNNPDNVESAGNSSLSFIYLAGEVNIVASGTGRVEVLVDEKPVKDLGTDLKDENGRTYADIKEERMYNLVSSQSSGLHLIQIIPEGDFKIYTFTFG